jgi:SrtB family sortase
LWSEAFLVIGLVLVLAASWSLLSGFREYSQARAEYAELREAYSQFQASPGYDGRGIPQDDLLLPESEIELGPESGFGPLPESVSRPAPEPNALVKINPDFAGWIFIEGTAVDYPIARGRDNNTYLNTTFNGERNPAGAVFMDYRCQEAFKAPICLLYGHNMKDGTMFASLNNYLDPAFLKNHSEIVITTKTGEELIYRVFEVRPSDAWDSVYSLEFIKTEEVFEHFVTLPEGASWFLILSTCLKDGGRDERLLVFSFLVEE